MDVAYEVTSVNVTPTANNSNATITVDGDSVESGTASADIALIAGNTKDIVVEVTAEDGTTKQTYTVSVTRADSSVLIRMKMHR